MKKLALVITLLFAVSLFAQNAPLPTQTWSTNFAPVSIPGLGQTFAGTIADLGIAPTPNSVVALETIQAPSAANFAGFYGAGYRYQINAFSKWLNDLSPNLSGYRFQFTVLGSAGAVVVANGNHFAATAGGRVDYALSSTGSWTLGVEVRAVRLPYVVQGWKPAVSLGPAIHW